MPLGSIKRATEELGQLSDLEALACTVEHFRRDNQIMFDDVPGIVEREKIDALIVDETYTAGGAIAERCGIPFVTICNALALIAEPGFRLHLRLCPTTRVLRACATMRELTRC